MSTIAEIKAILKEESEARRAGDRERALELLGQARAMALATKNREYLSEVENAYGNFHCRYTDIETEIKHRRRSVRLLGPTGHPLKLAVASGNLAGALLSAGRYAEALKYLYRSLDHFTRGLPDHTLVANCPLDEARFALTTIYTIANLYVRLHDYTTADGYLNLHRALEERLGHDPEPDALGLLVICASEENDLAAMKTCAERQLSEALRQHLPKAEAMALSALAEASHRLGDLNSSRSYNERGLMIARKIEDHLREMELLCNEAEIEIKASNFGEGRSLLLQACAMAEALKVETLNERIHRAMSDAFVGLEDHIEALRHYKMAMGYKAKAIDPKQLHDVARLREARVLRANALEKMMLTKLVGELAHTKELHTKHDIQHQLLQLAPSLTRTELKVCELLSLGATTKEIASELAASRHTIDGHRTAIRKKLGIASAENLSTWLMRAAIPAA